MSTPEKKLKIAIIGYGKMGIAIEEIAIAKGHTISLKIRSDNRHELTADSLKRSDVAIEFTNPESAFSNIMMCLDAGIPVVCGSTGWLNRWDEISRYCKEKKGCLLYASNFSIGVNILFELNKKLATLMATHPEYTVSIEETHHTQKKDAPSGTAISIADQIIQGSPTKKKWTMTDNGNADELLITSKRIDPVPGTHRITYSSEADTLELIHTAHNRSGFAKGALAAAEYIAGKKGIFTMKEVLDL